MAARENISATYSARTAKQTWETWQTRIWPVDLRECGEQAPRFARFDGGAQPARGQRAIMPNLGNLANLPTSAQVRGGFPGFPGLPGLPGLIDGGSSAFPEYSSRLADTDGRREP